MSAFNPKLSPSSSIVKSLFVGLLGTIPLITFAKDTGNFTDKKDLGTYHHEDSKLFVDFNGSAKGSYSDNTFTFDIKDTDWEGNYIHIFAAVDDSNNANGGVLQDNRLIFVKGNLGTNSSGNGGDVYLYGAYSLMGDVQNNSVEIQGGTFSANYDVYEGRYGRIVGGWSENGDVISNKVQISGGTFGRNMDIMGGRSTWDSNQMQLFAYNSVEIDGTNNVSIGVGTTGLDSPNIYGAYATIARAKNNTVTITNLKDQGKGQKFQTIVGTFLDTGSEAVQNGVEISNSEFAANAIAGVQTGWGSSEDVVDSNYVRIQNSTIRLYKYDGIEARISGSDSGSNNETSGNTVIIENSTISNTSQDSTAYITAAHTAGGDVHDNVVYLKNVSTEGNVVISGGSSTTTEDSYTGNIYTGHVYSNHVIVEGSDNDLENAILLGGDNDLEDAILLGGLSNDSNYISDNSLHLVNFSGKVGAIDNFDTIVFSDIEWKEDTTVLTITNQPNTDLSNTTIRVENIIFGTTVSDYLGESLTLIKNDGGTITFNQTYKRGVEVVLPQDLLSESHGTIQTSEDGSSLELEVDGTLYQNQQLKLVSNNRNLEIFFVNQAAELVMDNLDITGDQHQEGVRTFASIDGVDNQYKTDSHVDLHGISFIGGVGLIKYLGDSSLVSNLFVEAGRGNFREDTSYSNISRHISGDVRLAGGGVSARFNHHSGFYVEGSLRGGYVENELTDGLIDGSGRSVGYENDSFYFSTHAGLGWQIPIAQNLLLDIYGKSFYTYLPEDDTNIYADGQDTKVEFKSDESFRIRTGVRLYYTNPQHLTGYIGLAYQRDFSSDVEITVDAQEILDTKGMRGDIGMGELGLRYAHPEKPWHFDAKIRGHVGQRQGISGKVSVEYLF